MRYIIVVDSISVPTRTWGRGGRFIEFIHFRPVTNPPPRTFHSTYDMGSRNARRGGCASGRPPSSHDIEPLGPKSAAVRQSLLIVNSWSTVRSTLPRFERNTASITSSSNVGNIVLKSSIASPKSSPTTGAGPPPPPPSRSARRPADAAAAPPKPSVAVSMSRSAAARPVFNRPTLLRAKRHEKNAFFALYTCSAYERVL